MPLESLETLRLLTNLETEKRKLAQVILFGQPELDERLAHGSIRQLRQRITFQHHMGTLTSEETEHYLAHRLAGARPTGGAVVWPPAGPRGYPASRGGSPPINIFSHKRLIVSY